MNELRLSPEDPRLTAYALGELPPEEAVVLEAALAHDPAARAFVEETRELAAQLRQALADEPIEAAADAVSPLPSRLDQLPPYDGGRSRILRFPQLYFIVGGLAAACFAVMLAWHQAHPLAAKHYTVVNLADFAGPDASATPEAAAVATVEPLRATDVPSADLAAPFRRMAEPKLNVPNADGLIPTSEALASLSANAAPSNRAAAQNQPAIVESRDHGAAERPELTLAVTYRSPPPAEKPNFSIAAKELSGTHDAAEGTRDSAQLPTFRATETAAPTTGASTLAGTRLSAAHVFPGVDPAGLAHALKGNLASPIAMPPSATADGGQFVRVAHARVINVPIPESSGSFEAIVRAVDDGKLPEPSGVRIEALLNYGTPATSPGHPRVADGTVAAAGEVGPAPWAPAHRLVRLAIRAGGAPGGVAAALAARDVKVAVEFNPRRVLAYRLIGYERDERTSDRPVAALPGADFRANRSVVALFEVIPVTVAAPDVDDASYGPVRHLVTEETSRPRPELLTLRVDYRQPLTGAHAKVVDAIVDDGATFASTSGDFKYDAGVAAYGMILHHSAHLGHATLADAITWTEAGVAASAPDRAEMLDLMRRTQRLSH